MTLTAVTTVPDLPTEVHGHILSFCDPATLAVSSRVSLAFLQMTGPVLYEDITIRGKDQLEKLVRSEDVVTSVAPFVSLDRTKRFTYIVLDTSQEAAPDVSRRLSSKSVLVDSLVLRTGGQSELTPVVELPVLLASVDPRRLHLISSPLVDSSFGHAFDLDPGASWSQLQGIVFHHGFANRRLQFMSHLVGRSPLLDIEYHFSTLTPRALDPILGEIESDLLRGDPKKPHAFGRVQVWLHDDDQVKRAKAVLGEFSCTSLDIGVKR